MIWLIFYLLIGLLWAYFTDLDEDLAKMFDTPTIWMCRVSSILLWPVEVFILVWVILSGN